MKVTLKDRDNKNFDVGFDIFDNVNDEYEKETLFWIDTPEECVTIRIGPLDLLSLEKALKLLRKNYFRRNKGKLL